MIGRWRDRLWVVWVGAGVLATVAYFLLPAHRWYRGAWYDLIGLTSAILIGFGVRRHRPANAGLWWCFAAGEAIWVVGDVIYTVYGEVLHVQSYPSLADVFYLAAYPVLIAGMALLVRGRRVGRDRAGTLDACIVATGLGLVSWIFVMGPIAADATVTPVARGVSLAYPAFDVLMLAMVACLLTTPGAGTASYRLLVGALVLVLGADIAYSLATTFASYTAGPIDAGWLLSYVVWAAAALHPSMRTLSQPTRPAVGEVVASSIDRSPSGAASLGRLLLLGCVGLLAPGLLVEQGLHHPGRIDWVPLSAGGVLLCIFVFLRVAGLVRHIERQSAQLSQLAMQDELTGLANRRLLERCIAEGVAGGGAVQVALVDLDDFKAINDRLGHAVGDQLLVAVAQRLRAAVRPHDVVARLGGDEFAMVMPAATDAEADLVVRRVNEQLREPIDAGTHQLLVQASIGVTDHRDATDPLELLRRADIAMYAAKEAGGRRHLRYRRQLDEHATDHARLGAQLRRALDGGQFSLVYQPIVDLPHGRLVGVEALVRWRHPQRGMVSPAEFVPIAEQIGLVVELGDWVLERACKQAVAWRRQFGPAAPAKVSVNVSPRQLAAPGFADQVAAVLERTGLPARRLTIEVTETAVFGGGRSVQALHTIRASGVQVALDDFGTGHSSLGLLQTCPVDILKVDKSFVDNITMAGKHSVIAAALINVSDALSLTAIAEGIETAEQANELVRMGYRFAQGYHFGRPSTAEQLSRTFTSSDTSSVGLAAQGVDHRAGGGKLEFQADDAYGGVHADALVEQMPGAVGAVEVVAAVAAVPALRAGRLE